MCRAYPKHMGKISTLKDKERRRLNFEYESCIVPYFVGLFERNKVKIYILLKKCFELKLLNFKMATIGKNGKIVFYEQDN